MSSNSPSPHFWPILRWLVLATIPALVTLIPLIQSWTHNISLTIIILIICAIFLFLFYIGSKIFQQMEDLWIKELACAVDRFRRNCFSNYYRYYRLYFSYEHRDMDMKGLNTLGTHTLSLENAFVELHIDTTTPHEASADPLRLPAELRTRGHTIWEYLQAKSLRKEHFVLLGPPGSGKTTLLKHIGWVLLYSRKFHHARIIPFKLPLLLFLRNHSISIQETPNYSLVDAVRAQAERWKRPMPPGWIERQLDKGQCLILLDGLDEVADSISRQQTITWVEQQMIAYGRNRFVITSRPYGYRDNPLSKVTVLQVQPFTFKQVTKFVNKWYLDNEVKSTMHNDLGTQMKAQEDAQDLLQRLQKTPALFALAVNPLLLTMLTTVHRYRGSLPGARITLFKEICEVLLGKRQETRGIEQDLRADQRQLVLQPLAYHMMQQKRGGLDIVGAEAEQVITKALQQVSTQMTPKLFMQTIENVSGLLLEREVGKYAFAHKAFQEYLAAVYIREHSLEHILTQHVANPWWHETIKLYCAQANATPIITACLAKRPFSVEALTLALECLDEALQVEADIRLMLHKVIEQGIEGTDPEHRKRIAKVLLDRRLRQMYRLNEYVFIDTTPITHTEYQLFLDEQEQLGKRYQPDHWADSRYPPDSGHEAVLGVRQTDAQAFCNWLTASDKRNWRYRLPKREELQQAEKDINQLSKGRTKTLYWIDTDTGLNWGGNQAFLDNLTQERLDKSLTMDQRRFTDRSFDPNNSSDAIIKKSIRLARILKETQKDDLELNRVLRSIQKRVQTHTETLQKELIDVEQNIQVIRGQLKEIHKSNTSHSTNITKAQERINSLKIEQENAQNLIERYQREVVETQDVISKLKMRLNNASKRSLWSNRNESKITLQQDIYDSEESIRYAEQQIIISEQMEQEIQQKIANAERILEHLELTSRYNNQETEDGVSLYNKLKQQQQRKKELELENSFFRDQAPVLETIYYHVLPFAHAYDLKDAFAKAIKDNRVLDLDSTFKMVRNHILREMLEDAPTQLRNSVLRYVKALADNLVLCTISFGEGHQTKMQELLQDLSYAQLLANQLYQRQSNLQMRDLTNTLTHYLDLVSDDRLALRRNSALRWYIRYFSRVLAGYIQYWWWKEISPPTEQLLFSQQENDIYRSVIDLYLDIYVTFVMLEERIKGETNAHEGIFIARELEKVAENKTTDWYDQ